MAIADPLDITLDALGYRNGRGLVEQTTSEADPARAFVWNELQTKGGVDATYFRGSIPLVTFIRSDEPEEIASTHKRLWNLSRVPLLLAAGREIVGAYSCFRPPTSYSDVHDAQMIAVPTRGDIGQLLSDFARDRVETGRFAREHGAFFRRADRVDQRLLANLKSLRVILEKRGLARSVVEALIGSSIFVRYLEDRNVLTDEHFLELAGQPNYVTVLETGCASASKLFEELASHFNGDVFGIAASVLPTFQDEDLQLVAGFLRGEDVETGQKSFWPYDFAVIPPELVSSIYEQLLEETQRTDSAYYTPRTVVDLILDEVIPWHESRKPRVLDPACGSGIFLTEAFRRLAFRSKLSGAGEPSFQELSHLLTETMFGVDRSRAAVRVAAFGLYLALLEQIDPPTAWRDAKLPVLIDRNLFVRDFFEMHAEDLGNFDVIVANPPWQSELSPAAELYADTAPPIPDRQAAIAFLWRALDHLSPTGGIGLLMPSKPLLHNRSPTSRAFRDELFHRLEVSAVIDLSPLRRDLFEHAVQPAAVLIGSRAEEAASEEIFHAAVKPTPLGSAVDGFVMSQEDMHALRPGAVAAFPDIWKVLLWGGSDDVALISDVVARFRSLRAVSRERGWTTGQGFQIEGGDENPADHLVGMRFVPTRSVVAFAVTDADDRVEARVMHRPRRPELFRGPHVLVPRTFVDGVPAAALLEDHAAFNTGIFGIAAPATDLEYLKLVTAYINSSFARYFYFLTSSSWGVERDYLEVNEYLRLPFPEPSDRTAAAVALLDVRRTAIDRTGFYEELDEAVFDAYALLPDERDLVRDALTMTLEHFRHGKNAQVFRPPTRTELENYCRSLRMSLRAVLRAGSVDVKLEAVTASRTAVRITFINLAARNVPPENLAEVAALLEETESDGAWLPSPMAVIEPSVVLLRGNSAYIVKPNEIRHWTISRARADAAEVVGHVGLGMAHG